jgi:hypothetical protein
MTNPGTVLGGGRGWRLGQGRTGCGQPWEPPKKQLATSNLRLATTRRRYSGSKIEQHSTESNLRLVTIGRLRLRCQEKCGEILGVRSRFGKDAAPRLRDGGAWSAALLPPSRTKSSSALRALGLSGQWQVVGGGQKNHPAKIRPNGSPASLFFRNVEAGWAPRRNASKSYFFSRRRTPQAMVRRPEPSSKRVAGSGTVETYDCASSST